MHIIPKWKLRGVISAVTLPPYAFLSRVSEMHTILQQRCMKRTPDLTRGHQTGGEAQHGTTGYSYFVTPTVNMMSNGNRCFVCGKTGNIGHNCSDVQRYNCNSFGNYAQDCQEKIPPSGTPCHHSRSCSYSHNNHNFRDRSQSFHNRCSQGKCFDRSGSHHQFQCSRSSRNYQRYASCTLSHHHSS